MSEMKTPLERLTAILCECEAVREDVMELKEGCLINIQKPKFSINKTKLKELKDKYGECLSNKQICSLGEENQYKEDSYKLINFTEKDLILEKTTIIPAVYDHFSTIWHYVRNTPNSGRLFNNEVIYEKVFFNDIFLSEDDAGKDFEDIVWYNKNYIIDEIIGNPIQDHHLRMYYQENNERFGEITLDMIGNLYNIIEYSDGTTDEELICTLEDKPLNQQSDETLEEIIDFLESNR